MAASEASGKIICDAVSIIHLNEIDAVDLLSDFSAVYLRQQFLDEILQDFRAKYGL